MQRIKVFLQPKVLRMLALGLILIASLLLLIQDRYGTPYLVAVGTVTGEKSENIAIIDVTASYPLSAQMEIAVSASKLLINSIEKAGDDAEFLVTINQRGERLFFERVYLLSAPHAAGLQGPRSHFGQMNLAVGSQPELVEMVGLDRFGYQLSQPAWAKEKMPGADMAYYQRGNMDAVKDVLDGAGEFIPQVFMLDSQGRIAGMRSIQGRLLPLPELLRRTALWLYGAAVLAGLGSLLSYKWSALCRAGRRIWDHVSIRGRKASSSA